MKYIITLFFCLPLLAKSQSVLDSANGFKIFKLGSNISNYVGKLDTSDAEKNGTRNCVIMDSLQLMVGKININVGAVTVYSDTIRSIILILDGLNGAMLAQAIVHPIL